MKTTKLFALLFIGALLFSSCSSDDDVLIKDPENPTQPEQPENPKGAFANGFFVTNEGHFPDAGSVTFVSQDLSFTQQAVYASVNGGGTVGSVIQSMFFDEKGHAYIIANNSNMITVVDRYTFEEVGTITEGLNLPRYGVVENGKAYVTNQGNQSFVAVIDLASLSVEKTIDMSEYHTVEFIKKGGDNDMIYVQNASFGGGNTISVIDPTTNTIMKTYQTGDGLDSFDIDDNILYALSENKIQEYVLGAGTTTATEIPLNYESSVHNIVLENDKIYFTSGKNVYIMDDMATTAPAEPLFAYATSSAWGTMYGFDVDDNRIYIADGGDFVSDSFIEVHSLNGDLIQKVTVGIGPNGVYFND